MRNRDLRWAVPALPDDPIGSGDPAAAAPGIRRRDFVALVSAAAAAPALWPLAAVAQQPGRLPTIGFLGATTPTVWQPFVGAFLQRMHELGWDDNRNMTVVSRWAQGLESRYAEIAAEFVRLNVDVIVTSGTPAVMAVKKATSTIPVVFAAAGDPVGTGLVASLAHPGGNLTGLSNQQTDLGGHRLELLREIIPDLRRVAVMGNTDSPVVMSEMKAVETAAPTLNLETFRVPIARTEDIDPAIQGLKGRADALYICTDTLVTTHRVRINTMAMSQKLPTMNAFREYVQAGGLMSYGPHFPDLFRRAGDFVDKILRGAKPADIPVEQPVKFDLILNMTTAKALGLKIPASFLVRVNEVIE